MKKRLRFRHTYSLADCLHQMLGGLRERLETARPEEKKKLSQQDVSAEEALRIQRWMETKELRSPD